MQRVDTYRVVHHNSGTSDIRVWWGPPNNRETYVWTGLDPIRALLMYTLLLKENMAYINPTNGMLEISAEPVGAEDEEW